MGELAINELTINSIILLPPQNNHEVLELYLHWSESGNMEEMLSMASWIKEHVMITKQFSSFVRKLCCEKKTYIIP